MSRDNIDTDSENGGADQKHGGIPNAKDLFRKVESDEKLPFTYHLEELRVRLIYCAVVIALFFALLYSFSDALFEIVRRPMGDYEIISIAPAEAFFAYMKISFYGAIVLAMPVLLYHTWQFIAPGLLEGEKRYTSAFVIAGSIFFVIGASFCYFLVLPYGMEFLLGFAEGAIKPQITVGNYISFAFRLLIAFGLIFQLPIIIIILTKLGIVTPDSLASKRAYFIVGSFVISAILTPPDVFTQTVMALPIIILFESSLLVSRFINKKSEQKEDGDEK